MTCTTTYQEPDKKDRVAITEALDLIANELPLVTGDRRRATVHVACDAQVAHLLLDFIEAHIGYHSDGGPDGDDEDARTNYKLVVRLRAIAAKQEKMP